MGKQQFDENGEPIDSKTGPKQGIAEVSERKTLVQKAIELGKRIRATTPKKDKDARNITGTIGTILGLIALSGLVVNPVALLALGIGAVALGGKSVYHAQKTEGSDD